VIKSLKHQIVQLRCVLLVIFRQTRFCLMSILINPNYRKVQKPHTVCSAPTTFLLMQNILGSGMLDASLHVRSLLVGPDSPAIRIT